MAQVEASDGIALYAETHGGGTPVLFCCALNTTCENWRPQVEPFVAAGRRVVLWDYRGHGRSGVPDDAAAYSMSQVVDDLGRVLDWAAPDEPAVLVGLSFGGLASLHFALAQPPRVRALVLAGSGPGFKNPEARERWQTSCDRTASFLEAKGVEVFAQRAADMTVGLHPERPAARAATRAISAQAVRGLALFGRQVAGPALPVIDELAGIRVPALVIRGERDEAYARACAVMVAKLPDARSATLSGAGHILNLDEPAAFDAALLGFLDGLTAGSA
ncbi:MAG: alpha/beta fold hydrolase [Deltaproteobacteria bacterium]|nr:alpha/beta fold hydrolase [Deltaproteobacteria bacterium]MBW2359578.1 alpha/beta fold hydrolase [Deltaproteobacteria bacterium]